MARLLLCLGLGSGGKLSFFDRENTCLLSDLTQNQKEVFDNYIAITGLNSSIMDNAIETDCDFIIYWMDMFDHDIDGNLDSKYNYKEFDYNNFNQSDKDKIDAFKNLMEELSLVNL